MARFESKNTILTKKLNNIMYELMVKTKAEMVYTDSETTLTETLSDITDILTSHSTSFNNVMTELNDLIIGASSLSDSIREIWQYINVDGDPKSALIKMIQAKQDAEPGKGLSECDFTDILKEKLVNGYTRDELDEKFQILNDKIESSVPEGLINRITALENQVNISLSDNPDSDRISSLVDGSVWFKIIHK